MNRLSNEDRSRALACLVEGASIRSTVRITGISKKTVSRLLVEMGAACQQFANERLVNLPCKNIQCDEIWSFVGCANLPFPSIEFRKLSNVSHGPRCDAREFNSACVTRTPEP